MSQDGDGQHAGGETEGDTHTGELLHGFTLAKVQAIKPHHVKIHQLGSTDGGSIRDAFPTWEMALVCSLIAAGVPTDMCNWEGVTDQALKESLHARSARAYNQLEGIIYTCIVTNVHHSALEVLVLLQHPDCRTKGRHCMRLLKRRYEPRGSSAIIEITNQLKNQYLLEDSTPRAHFGLGRLRQAQLAELKAPMVDSTLLAMLLEGFPRGSDYDAVISVITADPNMTLEDAEDRLQRVYEREQQRAAPYHGSSVFLAKDIKPKYSRDTKKPGNRPPPSERRGDSSSTNSESSTNKYCKFHESRSHDTSECKAVERMKEIGLYKEPSKDDKEPSSPRSFLAVSHDDFIAPSAC
jgi:hypothetical protein